MKRAMVTGASFGIGRAFANKLAKAGYQVTGVARSEKNLQELAQSLGENFKFILADLSTAEGCSKVQQELVKTKYDLLVNNAGVGTLGTFTEVPLERQLAMLHLNNETLTALAYTFLQSAKSGDALINVSSALAFMPTPTMALYAATKAFVTSLSESLWFEYKSRGVYVMGLCPGLTDTNFQATSGVKKEELPKALVQTPEHVVDVALKALADRSKPTILTGIRNHMFAGVSRFLPRKSLVTMTGGMMPSNKPLTN